VEYINGRYGTAALLRIIENLRAGDDTDAALMKALYVDIEGLERKWQAHLKKKHTWLTFLVNNVYSFLFLFGALVLLYGFVRAVIRIKTYRDEDEEEEVHRPDRGDAPPPPWG
jgi:hypothetical protein